MPAERIATHAWRLEVRKREDRQWYFSSVVIRLRILKTKFTYALGVKTMQTQPIKFSEDRLQRLTHHLKGYVERRLPQTESES